MRRRFKIAVILTAVLVLASSLLAAVTPPPRVAVSIRSEAGDPHAHGCTYTLTARLKGGWPWTRAEWVSGEIQYVYNGKWDDEPYALTADDMLDYWGADRISRTPAVQRRTLVAEVLGENEVTLRFRYRVTGGGKRSTTVTLVCHGAVVMDGAGVDDPRFRRLDSLAADPLAGYTSGWRN